MTEQELIKERIKEEFKRCASDLVYFFRKYCYIEHPTKGKIKFDLYPFQEKTLSEMHCHDFNIILKSRQLGISTLTSAYALHMMLFKPNSKILIISVKQETAKGIVDKVRFAYDNLPSWLRSPYIENNKLSLKLTNHSEVRATTSSSQAGRGASISLLIIDEAAFVPGIYSIWTAAQSTLSAKGSRCILLSTPNGSSGFFYKKWISSKTGQDDGDPMGQFHPIRLHWSMHPDRDQKWRDAQDKLLGPRMAAQECDADFVSSGNTVLTPETIKYYLDNGISDPLEKRGYDNETWIWEKPDYNKQYIVSADVARGDGSDYSAYVIFDIEHVRQVAEFKGKIDTKEFGNMLVTAATEYNDALLVIENATVGWAAIQQVIDRGYPNLYYTQQDIKYKDTERQFTNKLNSLNKKAVAGFTTSPKVRPMMINKLEEYFRTFSIEIHSERLIYELQSLIWNGLKAEAAQGFNDDLVMCVAICLWVRDMALQLNMESVDFAKSMINSFQVNRDDISSHPILSPIMQSEPSDAWKLPIGNGEFEDLSQWL